MSNEATAEHHHLVGTSIAPGGIAKGCAHSNNEYRNYVDFGQLPNRSCPAIERWNNASRAALSGKKEGE